MSAYLNISGLWSWLISTVSIKWGTCNRIHTIEVRTVRMLSREVNGPIMCDPVTETLTTVGSLAL